MVTWRVSAAVEWIPVYSSPQQGTNAQEDTADNRDIKLFLSGCYVLGTWFDRWYIHIPVIMSRV